MLSVEALKVSVDDKLILKGLDLKIGPGEVHTLMGPNGSGKSTLAHVLAGREGYRVESGHIKFMDKNLLKYSPEERAQFGLFLAFQYPVELPGVNNLEFLRASLNAIRGARGEESMCSMDFIKLARDKISSLNMDPNLLKREVNSGFSGGEKKRNEMLQMAILEPRLAILDETDSGLDIDALRIVANGVNRLRSKDRSIILITHYQRLLDYIEPDYVHVLADGKIIKSGDKSLALELDKKGYGWLSEEAAA